MEQMGWDISQLDSMKFEGLGITLEGISLTGPQFRKNA